MKRKMLFEVCQDMRDHFRSVMFPPLWTFLDHLSCCFIFVQLSGNLLKLCLRCLGAVMSFVDSTAVLHSRLEALGLGELKANFDSNGWNTYSALAFAVDYTPRGGYFYPEWIPHSYSRGGSDSPRSESEKASF